MASKTSHGNFFEDFQIGQTIAHATPRTLTSGDVAIYTALYGSRFAVQSADTFAQSIGYERAPLDDLLVFHTVFGKTVPDISLNAIANLGYADCRFLKPVFPGDTLSTTSKVIGLRENSNRKTGVVYVRSTGRNQHGGTVVDYVRWVMVRKRDEAAVVRTEKVPELPASVDTDVLGHAVPRLNAGVYDWALAGSTARWDDYEVGERIDHAAGAMIEEA
ncbi:MAG: MaoC family dehydratase, partial [Alphaproteobacteria bacterium]